MKYINTNRIELRRTLPHDGSEAALLVRIQELIVGLLLDCVETWE